MAYIKYFAVAMAVVCIYTACAGDALANNANATKSAEEIAQAASPKLALVTLEKRIRGLGVQGREVWDTFLSDKFVGWGTAGKLDKRSATKEYTGAACEIKSYALSDERVSPRGKQAALITYKATVDGTCGGRQIPANSWAAGVYVRDGSQWKAAFHAQAAVVNPAVTLVKPIYHDGARVDDTAKTTAPDAGTGALLAIEEAARRTICSPVPPLVSTLVDTAKCEDCPSMGEGKRPQLSRVRHTYFAADEGVADLSSHEESARRAASVGPRKTREHCALPRYRSRRRARNGRTDGSVVVAKPGERLLGSR
jgi:hypothetical protein